MDRYFGSYQRFEAVSEKEAGYLLNSDNLVGDEFSIQIELNEGRRTAWLINKFDKRIGYFDHAFSRELSLMEAKGWNISAHLSYIAYSEKETGGQYWGEMAVIAFDPRFEASFTVFKKWLSGRLGENVRPRVDFDGAAVDKIIESNGTWTPDQTLPLPKFEKGTVIMKDELSLSDKFVEMGRQHNIGCYIVSWVFLIGVIAVIGWGVKTLLGL